MNILEAIFLGFIQGATEFLPISSSGHLVLIPAIFGLSQPNLSLIAIAHLGTLLAVLIYFWHDLWAILIAVLQGLRDRDPMGSSDSRLGWYIVVGSIPAAVIGLLFADFFEEVFGSPQIAAFFLLITAVLLVFGERVLTGVKSIAQMNWPDAIIVGLTQTMALFPGVSRSGSTIAAGLWRGLDRESAARYSFLLGVPAILGAGLLSVFDIISAGNIGPQLPIYIATFLTAAVVGYACIAFLLRWLRNHSFYVFAIYCALLGGGYLLYSFLS